MNCNPDKHHRRSIRLQGYDYRQAGAYYITICCHQRQCLLGEIVSGIMRPNLIGETVVAVWNSLQRHFSFIELDAFVLMPNHVHGIILITDTQPEFSTPNAFSSSNANSTLPHGTIRFIGRNCAKF